MIRKIAQITDWENIRVFIAVGRCGSLSGAARQLHLDHATVSRRLAALESDLGIRLVDRMARSCALTAIGSALFERAVNVEEAIFGLERLARAADEPEVTSLTLSAPPVLVAHLLAGALASFRAELPDIRISIIGEARQISLARQEADIALRLVRPKDLKDVARKVGIMPFAFYAERHYLETMSPADWQFIAYDNESMGNMPQQEWLLDFARGRPIACELNDIHGHLIAAQAGVGIAGLPCFIGDRETTLQRVDVEHVPFSRDIWMVVHEDLQKIAAVGAVKTFIRHLISATPGLALHQSQIRLKPADFIRKVRTD